MLLLCLVGAGYKSRIRGENKDRTLWALCARLRTGEGFHPLSSPGDIFNTEKPTIVKGFDRSEIKLRSTSKKEAMLIQKFYKPSALTVWVGKGDI